MTQTLASFDLTGKTAVITGGCGVLCFGIAQCLAGAGARVALLDRDPARGAICAESIGPQALSVVGDVLDPSSLADAATAIADAFGPADILVNCAGGNRPDATTTPDTSFFELPPDALRSVIDLNLMGTLLPIQTFGPQMAQRGAGVILNISSMSAFRPLTRVVAYSAAKAAVNNLTQWLAVHLAQNVSPRVRVNAIAPGFFLTDQNRYLLLDETSGDLTPRGELILAHTPAGRFGQPEDLYGTVLWLVSDASAFVNGVVVPIDGGYNAFSGV